MQRAYAGDITKSAGFIDAIITGNAIPANFITSLQGSTHAAVAVI